MTALWIDTIGLFPFLAGSVIGLGVAAVIDIHGFLGRKLSYWTEVTTRMHKVAKSMIWAGIVLAIIGGFIFCREQSFASIPLIHAVVAFAFIVNGYFLSFKVSLFLLKREKDGLFGELLIASWQRELWRASLSPTSASEVDCFSWSFIFVSR